MGLFDMFRKQQRPLEPNANPGNRVDELANRLSREGRVGDVESALAEFKTETLSRIEQESWHHIGGIAAFRRGDRIAAFERFKKASELFPTSAQISFSLGQEHEFRGEPTEAFRLFDQAAFPAVPASHALAAARYAYLWNELDRGFRYLRPIVDAYFKLGIGDDHFLFVRGLPFIGQTWNYLACFQYLMGDLENMKQQTATMAARITDYDFREHLTFLDCWMASDFQQYEASLEAATVETGKKGFPAGFQAMQLAMLKSQRAIERALAEQILRSLNLKPNDFPWLEDVRLLGISQVAHRFGDSAVEATLLASFRERQALLFEPDHAVTFQLIDYQERLKEIYRQGRLAKR